MKKKNDVVVIVIIITTILVIGYLLFFNIKKNTKVEIVASVKRLGNNYIVVMDEDNNEYQLNTTKSYEIGDKITATIKNIKGTSLKTCEVLEIKTLSKTVEFAIVDELDNEKSGDNKEESNLDGDDNSENGAIGTQTLDVVSYFSNYYNELSDNNISENTIKESFVTLVDFIFYDGEINSTTFKELTTEAKLKVLHFFLKIDSKMEEKYPNYKNTISSAGNKVYTNAKSKALELYLNITTDVCVENVSVCETAKEGLKDLKNNFSLTFEFIRTIAGKGIDELASWYKIWKEI